MVKTEDKKIEKLVFDKIYDSAIPVYVREENGKDVEICVLSCFKKDAKEFEHRFRGRYFSRAAHLWWLERAATKMAEFGYFSNRQSRRVSTVMIQNAPVDFTLSRSKRIYSVKNKLTYTDIEGMIENSYVVFGISENDTLVSLAYTDMPLPENTSPDFIEVGIETAKNYRRLGYAKENLLALCKFIEEKGAVPMYVTSIHNRASVKTALSCGFSESAREYALVMRS